MNTLALLLVLAVSAGAPGEAAGGSSEAVLRGTVRSEGSLEPVPHASVRVRELDRTVVADEHGVYVLSRLPAGRWTVECAALGHETVEIVIVASAAGVVRLDFELPLQPLLLPDVRGRAEQPAIAVVAELPSPVVGPPAVRLHGPALRLLPGLAEPDVLRALQILPAVAATSDFSSALYVRGGSGDQTIITLDGIPLFNPYHVGGIFSAVTADAVSSVEIWPGAMPARGGDRLSGAVDIRTRDGGRDRLRANGSLGLISATLGVDGPLPGGNGSYLFTGRRTYLDAATRAAHALGVSPVTMPYGFSDAYAKVSHDLGALGTVSFSGYIDVEAVEMPDDMAANMGVDADFDWGSRMLAVNLRRPIGEALLLNVMAGYTQFGGRFDGWTLRKQYPNRALTPDEEANLPVDTIKTIEGDTEVRDIVGAVSVTWYGGPHVVTAGAQVDDYRLTTTLDRLHEVEPLFFPAIDRSTRPRTVALHVEDEWRASERFQLRGGVRYLDAGDLGAAWLPRFGARFEVSPAVVLSIGGGANAQALRSTKDEESVAASFLAYDILAAQPREVGLATSRDLVLGAEWRGAETRVRADVFVKRMDGLVLPPEPEDPLLAPPLIPDTFRIGEGRAHGLELLASGTLRGAELTTAYTLSFAGRRVDGDWYTPRFERRHMLDINLGLPHGENGLLTSRLSLASGQPYTPVIGHALPFTHDPALDGWDEKEPYALLGEHNSERLPRYLRVDLAYRTSIERRWFGRDITISPYAQVINVLNTKNVLLGAPSSTGNPSGARSLKTEYYPQLPILPTVGVEWRF